VLNVPPIIRLEPPVGEREAENAEDEKEEDDAEDDFKVFWLHCFHSLCLDHMEFMVRDACLRSVELRLAPHHERDSLFLLLF